MGTYWKQSLWIGGIYWVFSLVFKYIDSQTGYLIDAGLSVLMLIALLPMIKFLPAEKLTQIMKKMPLLSTLLVSAGWVPYFVGTMIVISSVVAVVIALIGVNYDYWVYNLFQVVGLIDIIRRLVLAVAILAAVVSVLFFKKSVVGCLDKSFRATESDACNIPTLNEAAVVSAKNMYACKEAVKECDKANKAEKVKKAPAKKKTAAAKKNAVKTAEAKKSAPKKASVKKSAAKAPSTKKTTVKK